MDDKQAALRELARREMMRREDARVTRNPDGSYGEVPEGMVYDPETNRMVDAGAIAREKVGTGAKVAGTLAQSLPIVGGTLGALTEQVGGPVTREIGEQALKQFAEDNPKTTTGLQIAGGVVGVAPMVAAAPVAFGAAPGMGLGSASLYSGLSGAGIGGVDAAIRSDIDPWATAQGALVGGVTGAVAPGIAKGIGKAGNWAAGKLGLNRQKVANEILADALRQSGKSADDIGDDLARAVADDQGEYAVMDALGQPGRRLASSVTRNPNEARAALVNALERRQRGQPDRMLNALDDAFGGVKTTAEETRASLAAKRAADARVNYPASSQGARPVNLTRALGDIDNLLNRDPILGDSSLAKSEIGRRIASLRARMANGSEQLVDYDQVLNLKSDLFDMRKANPQFAAYTNDLYKSLDDALEEASQGYRLANDTYRGQSMDLDALDKGFKAGSTGRAQDNINTFNAINRPTGQDAYRTGYGDRQARYIEGPRTSPTSGATNHAKMSLKQETEYPVIARPGQGDKLMRRIGRENEMFDTYTEALKGSRTADNNADNAFAEGLDFNFIRHPIRSAGEALAGGLDRVFGPSQRVREIYGPRLMETDPQAARAMFDQALTQQERATLMRNLIARALLEPSNAGASGRIAP